MNIKELENIYENRTIFVVGSGTSLHFQNIELLKNYPVIAVNAGIIKYPDADLFLSDDADVQNFAYFWDLLPNLKCNLLLYKDKPWKSINHIDKNRIIWYKHRQWKDVGKNLPNYENLVFSKDTSVPLIAARNSTGTAINVAYILGAKNIILLGTDCSFDKNTGHKYFWQFSNEYNELVKRKNGRTLISPVQKTTMYKGRVVDLFFSEFIEYWKALAKQAEKQDIKIIDSSMGALDGIFEQMPLEKVLEKYKE